MGTSTGAGARAALPTAGGLALIAGLALATSGLAGGGLAGDGRARDGRADPPAADERRGESWEYGTLVITGDVAVLVTERTVQRVEIPLQPEDQSTIFRNAIGPFERRFSPRLYSLNQFGAMGWLIDESRPLEDGDSITVRRRR